MIDLKVVINDHFIFHVFFIMKIFISLVFFLENKKVINLTTLLKFYKIYCTNKTKISHRSLNYFF